MLTAGVINVRGAITASVVLGLMAGASVLVDAGQGNPDKGRQVLGMYKPPARIKDNRPSIWNDPSVLREGDGYSMWASKGVGGPKDVAIYKLRSRDGETWQVENDGRPVLEPGGKRDFDSLGVETPVVIKVGTNYHMYYSAYPHGKIPLVTIGHAVSNDGIHWKKLGELTSITKPVGQNKGNPWGRLGRGEPAVVYHNNEFYLYFTDVKCRQDDCKGTPAVVRGISLATSRDGHTFEQRGNAPILLQTASFPPSQGWEGYSTPWVFVNNGTFELFADVFRSIGKQSIQTAITHLRSDDGVRFTEVDANVLNEGGDDWTAVSVRSPSVLVEDGRWMMWYAGDNYDPAKNKPRGSRVDAGIGLMQLRSR
jgi:predicted GH43/DUF377 family glycosyl hydrolase